MIGVLGQGGMGMVYEAEDRRLQGKRWAIKEVRASDFGIHGIAKEVETLIQLSHPNLPRIVDYFVSEDGKIGYLVMDRINGQTMEQKFQQNGRRFDLLEMIDYSLQLCDA